MDFFKFYKDFETALSRLKLPSDCTQHEPEWEPTLPPLFWQVTVIFDFASDSKHIRIWESYEKIGGLYMSRRNQWSYHYGRAESFDEDGKSERGSPDDPVDLRIDTTSGLHMHYQQREPHYRQDQIDGLNLKSVEAVGFVRAVLRHRSRGQDFAKILGFKIKGA